MVQVQPGNLRLLLAQHEEYRVCEFRQFRQVVHIAQVQHLKNEEIKLVLNLFPKCGRRHIFKQPTTALSDHQHFTILQLFQLHVLKPFNCCNNCDGSSSTTGWQHSKFKYNIELCDEFPKHDQTVDDCPRIWSAQVRNSPFATDHSRCSQLIGIWGCTWTASRTWGAVKHDTHCNYSSSLSVIRWGSMETILIVDNGRILFTP